MSAPKLTPGEMMVWAAAFVAATGHGHRPDAYAARIGSEVACWHVMLFRSLAGVDRMPNDRAVTPSEMAAAMVGEEVPQ